MEAKQAKEWTDLAKSVLAILVFGGGAIFGYAQLQGKVEQIALKVEEIRISQRDWQLATKPIDENQTTRIGRNEKDIHQCCVISPRNKE